MRIIDADEFESYLINRYGGNDCADDIIDDLHNQPTVDSVERKRGRWIKNEGRFGWHCSECKVDNYYAYVLNSETGKNDLQDRYCPNCGADMRTKETDRKGKRD